MNVIIKGKIFVEGDITALNQIHKDEFDDFDKLNYNAKLEGNILIKGNLIVEKNLIYGEDVTAYSTLLSPEEKEFYAIFDNDLKINGDLIVDNIKSAGEVMCFE